jgi:hypothetical protein
LGRTEGQFIFTNDFSGNDVLAYAEISRHESAVLGARTSMVEFEYTTPGSVISKGGLSILIDDGAASTFVSLGIAECSSLDCRTGSSQCSQVRSNIIANTREAPMSHP